MKPYYGTYQSIKTDRYHTSIENVQYLEEKNLYNTGTLISNGIAKELRWSVKEGRNKVRGQFDHYRYKHKFKLNNKTENIDLVVWKDCKPVCVLTTEWNTALLDKRVRRSKHGLLYIDRPISVSEYNTFMGGVDVSDMKRLFCKSRVHGISRW